MKTKHMLHSGDIAKEESEESARKPTDRLRLVNKFEKMYERKLLKYYLTFKQTLLEHLLQAKE